MRKNEYIAFKKRIKESLAGREIPILVLDTRWHALFLDRRKPADIIALEDKLNKLLKRQGKLVNEIKGLKNAKKKLMNGIVAGMDGTSGRDIKKKEKQQKLFLETKNRIEDNSDELMDIPGKIKEVNEELLVLGIYYCFEWMQEGDRAVKELNQEIKEIQAVLNDKIDEKEEISEKTDKIYSLLHTIFGPRVMNMYEEKHL